METGGSQGKRLGTPESWCRPGMPHSEEFKKFQMRLLSVLPHRTLEASLGGPRGLLDKLLSFCLEAWRSQWLSSQLRDWMESSCKWSLPTSESVAAATNVPPQMAARPAHFVCQRRQALIAGLTDIMGCWLPCLAKCWLKNFVQRPPIQARSGSSQLCSSLEPDLRTLAQVPEVCTALLGR